MNENSMWSHFWRKERNRKKRSKTIRSNLHFFVFEFKQTIEKYISVKQNCYRSNFSMLYNSSLCSTLKWIQLFIRQDYFVNLECVWCALLNTKISSIPTFKFIRLFAGVYKRENQTQKVMLIGWELLWRIDKRERFQSDISSVDHL